MRSRRIKEGCRLSVLVKVNYCEIGGGLAELFATGFWRG